MTPTKAQEPKGRRPRGDGAVYLKRQWWWFAYTGPDGKRIQESSHSTDRAVAERLVRKRIGRRDNHLPLVKYEERLRFVTAAESLITLYRTSGKPSLPVLTRRIRKHLIPFFGRHRLAGIDATMIRAYMAHRQRQGIVAHKGARKGERVADVSNAEINRELQTLKRIFSLAIDDGRLAQRPKFTLLDESDPRSGFFEAHQYQAVLAHLPKALRPVRRESTRGCTRLSPTAWR